MTGSEYLLAKSQKCKFNLHDIIYTPFKRLEDSTEIKPFRQILQQVQKKRREFAHAILVILCISYKEIGKNIYGSVVRGLSNKRKFDIKTKAYKRLQADDLSNPLIAAGTTAFISIRSIIGECLHKIQIYIKVARD